MLYCTQTHEVCKKVLKIELPIATDLAVYICYFAKSLHFLYNHNFTPITKRLFIEELHFWTVLHVSPVNHKFHNVQSILNRLAVDNHFIDDWAWQNINGCA